MKSISYVSIALDTIENTTFDEEQHLWAKFIDGDDASYELIYNKYIDVLFRYGIQFTKEEEVVKDAIHDVFVKIYTDRKRLKMPDNIKFFLLTCVKNHLFNILRRGLVFDKLDEDEQCNIPDVSSESEVTQHLEENDKQENIAKIMNVLTERQREVIYYRYMEELNIQEITGLMNMNYQSVQNLIQRSLKKIRESFDYFILFYICFCIR